jgi:hypothetical protein
MNQHPPTDELAAGSLGEGQAPESTRPGPDDTPEIATETVVASGQFVAWLAIGFAGTLVGAFIGLVLYILFGLEGDERLWGGLVLIVGVIYSLLGAAAWAIVPPIAALIDRKLAIGAVLLGFLGGVVSFSVIG